MLSSGREGASQSLSTAGTGTGVRS